MGYKIGSFNMYKFTAYRSDDEIKKDLNKIADIIHSEGFDVVALQEIFDKNAMDRLLGYLPHWAGAHESPRKTASRQAAEGFAFIWNIKRLRLVTTQTETGERTYFPRIFNQYRLEKGQSPLVRNPYFARFTPSGLYGGAFFEIRIINAHIMFAKGKTHQEQDAQLQYSDIKMRKNEFNVLAKTLYPKLADRRYGNNMPAYTVLLGDYNLNLKRNWTKPPYLEEVIEISDNQKTRRIRTVQDQLTSLKMPKKDENGKETEESRGYANNYDHFTYDESYFAEKGASVKARRIDTVRKYCNDDFALHRKVISDHIPVAMDFSLTNEFSYIRPSLPIADENGD